MNVVIEGDRLSGKSTVVKEMLAEDHSYTVIENRSIANVDLDRISRSEISIYYEKLAGILGSPFGKYILIRGPMYVYASCEGIDRDFVFSLIERFLRGGNIIAFLDIEYRTYIERFKEFVSGQGAFPYSANEFERRRSRYHELISLDAAHLRAVCLDNDDYRSAAQALIQAS